MNPQKKLNMQESLKERIKNLEEALESMCYQFAYDTKKEGVVGLSCGGLSALENAFYVLGWGDFYPTPELTCEVCGEKKATCGTPAPKSKYDPKTGATTSWAKNYYRCCGDCHTKLQNS